MKLRPGDLAESLLGYFVVAWRTDTCVVCCDTDSTFRRFYRRDDWQAPLMPVRVVTFAGPVYR